MSEVINEHISDKYNNVLITCMSTLPPSRDVNFYHFNESGETRTYSCISQLEPACKYIIDKINEEKNEKEKNIKIICINTSGTIEKLSGDSAYTFFKKRINNYINPSDLSDENQSDVSQIITDTKLFENNNSNLKIIIDSSIDYVKDKNTEVVFSDELKSKLDECVKNKETLGINDYEKIYTILSDYIKKKIESKYLSDDQLNKISNFSVDSNVIFNDDEFGKILESLKADDTKDVIVNAQKLIQEYEQKKEDVSTASNSSDDNQNDINSGIRTYHTYQYLLEEGKKKLDSWYSNAQEHNINDYVIYNEKQVEKNEELEKKNKQLKLEKEGLVEDNTRLKLEKEGLVKENIKLESEVEALQIKVENLLVILVKIKTELDDMKNRYFESVKKYIKAKIWNEFLMVETSKINVDCDFYEVDGNEEKGILLDDNQIDASIIDIYDAIKNSKPDEGNFNLYLDTQGGPRDNMIILSGVIEMLKHQKIEFTETYATRFRNGSFSNEIYKNTEKYKTFNLVTGLDELIEYIKIDKLKSYFDNQKADLNEDDIIDEAKEIYNILFEANDNKNSLIDILDCVQICQLNSIEDHIKDFLNSVYGNENEKGLKEKLEAKIKEIDIEDTKYKSYYHKFLFVLNQIQNNIFSEFITKNKSIELDVMVLLEWFMKYDLLQQALTICEDRSVDYFVKNKIFVFKDHIKNAECFINKISPGMLEGAYKDKKSNGNFIFQKLLADMKNPDEEEESQTDRNVRKKLLQLIFENKFPSDKYNSNAAINENYYSNINAFKGNNKRNAYYIKLLENLGSEESMKKTKDLIEVAYGDKKIIEKLNDSCRILNLMYCHNYLCESSAFKYKKCDAYTEDKYKALHVYTFVMFHVCKRMRNKVNHADESANWTKSHIKDALDLYIELVKKLVDAVNTVSNVD